MKKTSKSIAALTGILFLLVFTWNQKLLGEFDMRVGDQLNTSAGEITIITPENKTYAEPDSGYYPATYGFENDKSGQHPAEWDIYEGGGTLEVIPEMLNHQKVIKIYRDSTPSEWVYMSQNVSPQTYGTIEFWVLIDDVSKFMGLILEGSGSVIIFFGIRYSKWQYASTVWNNLPNIPDPLNNTWYHVRMHFECSTSNYMSLRQYKLEIIVNGVSSGEVPFQSNQNSVDYFDLRSGRDEYDYYGYFDSVGVSWDPTYIIGDNVNEGLLLNYVNSTFLDWKSFSLDGQANRTILGNSTIPMPSNGQHNIQIYGNDSIGTIFESDLRYFSINITKYIHINNPEEKVYTQPDSGYYPATYGFERDRDGVHPSDWNILEDGGIVQTKSLYNNHRDVVEFYRNSVPSQLVHIGQNIASIPSGTIEFWVSVEDITQFMGIESFDDGIQTMFLGIRYSEWHYATSSGWMGIPNIPNPKNNTWYHVRIHFECSLGGYQGLGQYKMEVIVNGTSSGELNMRNNRSEIDFLRFLPGSSGIAGDYYGYIDAIGFSWDTNYNIGDNLNEGLIVGYDSNINFDWQGYSLDGTANRTILGNTTLKMPNDGVHKIQVFGNDTIGTMYESAVQHFSVDMIPPEISLTYPSAAQEFSDPPAYILSITEENIAAMWYTLNGGSNIPFVSETGTIDSTAWNSLANGPVTLRFFVRDIADREAFEEVIVVKIAGEGPTPPQGVPSYNLIALIGVIVVISAIIIRKRLKS